MTGQNTSRTASRRPGRGRAGLAARTLVRGLAILGLLVVGLGACLTACSSTPAALTSPAGEGGSAGTNPGAAQPTAAGPAAPEPGAASPGAPGLNPTEPISAEAPVAAPDTPAAEKTPESAEAIQVKWQEGPHAATYVLAENGKNDTCARCHAPVNWIPSLDDMPESCYACKFEVDPPPPVIAEEVWTHVECKICHQMKKKEVLPEISWLEIAQIDQYAAIGSATELCLKCHVSVEVPGHLGTVSEGAHVEMACSDCHDAHSMAASCGEAGCHEALDVPGAVIAGHDEDHAQVSCGACHDSSGLEVGPDASGAWVTFRPQEASVGSERLALSSHNTVLEAPCERCHFAANPWGLSLLPTPTP